MRKLILTVIAIGCSISLSNAFDANEFEIQTETYQASFDELANLEEYVTANDYTLSDLSVYNQEYVAELKLDTRYTAMSTLEGSEPPLGLPSFVWGLCCGVTGLALVYFVTDDSDEVQKALWGCVAGTAIYGVFWLVYYLLVLSYAYY